MKLIKEYIKQIVISEMAMMKAIDQRKTALMIKKEANTIALYLYRPNFFYQIDDITQQKRNLEYEGDIEFLKKSIFPDAMIIKPGDEKFVGSIAGLIAVKLTDSIYEVQFSRAETGTGAGPMMYEIAMSLCGELTADRESITNEASNVWKKFYERTDITHKKLPKEFHVSNSSPWLNYSYKLKKGVGQDLNVLRAVHNMACETYSAQTGLTKNDIEDILYQLLLTRYNLD